MQDKELSKWFDINVQNPWEHGFMRFNAKATTILDNSLYSKMEYSMKSA